VPWVAASGVGGTQRESFAATNVLNHRFLANRAVRVLNGTFQGNWLHYSSENDDHIGHDDGIIGGRRDRDGLELGLRIEQGCDLSNRRMAARAIKSVELCISGSDWLHFFPSVGWDEQLRSDPVHDQGDRGMEHL